MIGLYNAATNKLLGSITEPDLQVLADALELGFADGVDVRWTRR